MATRLWTRPGAVGGVLLAALACMGPLVQPPPPPGFLDMATPVRDVPAGEVILPEDLFWIRLPQDYVPQEVAGRSRPLIGRRVAETLLAREPIREERLAPDGGTPWPEALLLPGNFSVDPIVPDEAQVFVIVAARELPPGGTIAEDDLYAVQIPPRFLPEGVFLSPEHVVGRVPCSRILQNEFVRAERLLGTKGATCSAAAPGAGDQ